MSAVLAVLPSASHHGSALRTLPSDTATHLFEALRRPHTSGHDTTLRGPSGSRDRRLLLRLQLKQNRQSQYLLSTAQFAPRGLFAAAGTVHSRAAVPDSILPFLYPLCCPAGRTCSLRRRRSWAAALRRSSLLSRWLGSSARFLSWSCECKQISGQSGLIAGAASWHLATR